MKYRPLVTDRGRIERLLPVLVGVLGILSVFHPMLASGFALTHGGLGDGRLINFTLEHGYLWLTGEPGHEELWSPAIFYPQKNAGAYTDVLLGVAPGYWAWRLLGAPPDTAFQLWLLLVWAANFVLAFLLLRGGLGTGIAASSIGAYLLAFSNAQDWTHPQMTPLPWVLLSMIALFRIFDLEARRPGSRRAGAWFLVLFAAAALQLYTSFYPFFFFGLLLALCLAAALLGRGTRRPILDLLRNQWPAGALGLAGVSILTAPLIAKYLGTATELGFFRLQDLREPDWPSWLLLGPTNHLYGWLSTAEPFRHLRPLENSNGLGLVTTAVAVAGLVIASRRRPALRILSLSTLLLVVAATRFGSFTPWHAVHAVLPGAAAIRAVWRICVVLLPVAAIGIAFAFDRLASRRRWVVFALLAALCAAEQLRELEWRDKGVARRQVAELADRVDPGWQAFFLVSTGKRPYLFVHDDAAWVHLATGVPTVNGRYGRIPKDWRLKTAHVSTPADRDRLRQSLDSWLSRHSIDPSRVGWIEYRPR